MGSRFFTFLGFTGNKKTVRIWWFYVLKLKLYCLIASLCNFLLDYGDNITYNKYYYES